MICERCGANVDLQKRQCPYCGFYPPALHPQQSAPAQPAQPVVVNVYNTVHEAPAWPARSVKSRWVALFLCLCFGFLGLHKFYVGKVGAGILYLLSFGLFGIGWVVDIFIILLGASTDKWGRKLL